jgi:amino-acid N-acetyltransferase
MSATPKPPPERRFIDWFRAAAPYIHRFRGRTFVIAFGGEVIDDGQFTALAHDIALLASLGVKLALVHGARPQIEALARRRDVESQFVRGVRVTDAESLACVKQASGSVRVEIEALLSMGLPNTPMANAAIRVAGGNFVVAAPRGVLDGIDMMYSGVVRKVDAGAIKARLEAGDIVLLSPIGYSPSGEAFNLTFEELGTQVAAALGADKLLFVADVSGATRGARGRLVRELTVSDAEALLRKGATNAEAARLLVPMIDACRRGVSRAHLISRHVDGALLAELFTHRGVGTMVTQDRLERLRPARVDDVGAIVQLLAPLEADGTLVRRSREMLEREIGRFHVLEHDRLVLGCVALYPFPEDQAGELACLVVHPEHRDSGHGERLLANVEARARAAGLKRLFALTTRTAHWFIENGFREGTIDGLPRQRKAFYNYQRRSKVFVKPL